MENARPVAAIFCKSFRPDFERLERLVDSVERFVEPDICLLLSVPAEDRRAADAQFGRNGRVQIVCDEDYVRNGTTKGWVGQQICKMNVFRTGFADLYFAIDSDSYFIRPFGYADFHDEGGCPKVIASPVFTGYEDWNTRLKALLDGAEPPPLPIIRPEGSRPRLDLSGLRTANLATLSAGEREPLLELVFGRQTRGLAFQPCQFLAAAVLRSLEEDLLAQDVSLHDALHMVPWEYNWYGSYCLHSRPIALALVTSPTIMFATLNAVENARQRDLTHAVLARHFAAVQMAARHHDTLSLE
ncbi:DUF6492 family protein [Roseicella sp. DB1501]|uniref:DUF6492 family protein n=1 Tax=Roseicella sp. DB1501 TaxID=2730925 RepID=UPI0014921A3D|nr:hypothetical protein [Roseicella sp. DB1501]